MFEPGKISEHGFPRLGASEALLAVPLVRHFAETVLQRHPQRQRMQKEIRSLLSMCSAALAVQGAKRGVVTGAEVLRLTSEHVANHTAAYGECKPKHHMAMHIGAQVVADNGLLIDCFVHERKHQDLKKFATNKTQVETLPKCVLQHQLWFQAQDMKERIDAMRPVESFLKPPSALSLPLEALHGLQARVAREARLSHGDRTRELISVPVSI